MIASVVNDVLKWLADSPVAWKAIGTLVLAVWGLPRVQQWVAQVRAHAVETHASDALTIVQEAVLTVYDTYVEEIKLARADGKLTAAERRAARNKAIRIAFDKAAKQGASQAVLDYLKHNTLALIEKAVGNTKAR